MNAVVAEQTQDQFPTATMQPAPAQGQNLQPFTESAEAQHYALRRRQAVDYSKSEIVPEQYRGKVANILIAMEIADRIGASHLAVMQQLYIVKGKPSWSSQFLIATVNASGRFTPIRFEIEGEDPHDKKYRVRAYATDIKTGDECKGPWITWKMVDAEKWGSKWQTIPGQMFPYRAATFWARLYAPEISMGLLTHEEARDIDVVTLPDSAVKRTDLRMLESKLSGGQEVSDADIDPPPPVDLDGVLLTREGMESKFAAITDADKLHEAFDLVRSFPNQEDRTHLLGVYERRLEELEK